MNYGEEQREREEKGEEMLRTIARVGVRRGVGDECTSESGKSDGVGVSQCSGEVVLPIAAALLSIGLGIKVGQAVVNLVSCVLTSTSYL
jgi:hypothetical protein